MRKSGYGIKALEILEGWGLVEEETSTPVP